MRSPALLLAAALVAAACARGETASPEPSVEPLIAVASEHGVDVRLALAGPPVSGLRSWATVRIENTGARAVRWAAGGCEDPAAVTIDLRGAFEAGREWPGLLGRFKLLAVGGAFGNPAAAAYVEASKLRDAAEPVVCPASLRIAELEPGGVLEMRAAWSGTLGHAPAPTGPALVTASFPFIGIAGDVAPDVTDAQPIVATVRTRVVGDGRAHPLSPALAVDAALSDPEFARFVLAAPEATWVNPHLVLTDDGSWAVGLFHDRGGGLVSFGVVTVDRNGAVLSRRFDP